MKLISNMVKLTEHATKIGDWLIDTSVETGKGITWNTHKINGENITWFESDSIYNGTTGEGLFLFELFNQTMNDKYLKYGSKAFDWVHSRANEVATSHPGLFTGRMSVSIGFLRAYEITKNEKYLEVVRQIAKEFLELKIRSIPIDFINGLSGVTLGLTKIYSVLGEKWLLRLIESNINKIIDSIQVAEKGIYWDRSGKQIRGLCGFSHGASGVGYVLLELGNYFDIQSLLWLGQQAFHYENQYLDLSQKNWPDFRKGAYTLNEENEFASNYDRANVKFFTEGKFINAWCHGAAGIAIARARAFEITGKSIWKNDFLTCVEKTYETHIASRIMGSFTLCHGAAGNGEVFLEAHRIFGDSKYLNYAIMIAERAIEEFEESKTYTSGTQTPTTNDPTMFLGTAGIGYYYLRVIDPNNVPSMLSLRLPSGLANSRLKPSVFFSSPKQCVLGILRKEFPWTLLLLELHCKYRFDLFFDRTEFFKENFKTYFRESVVWMIDDKVIIADAFHFENAISLANESVISDALLHRKNQINASIVESLLTRIEEKLTLVIDSDITIISSKWNWTSEVPTSNATVESNKPSLFRYLVIPTIKGAKSICISDFVNVICGIFKEPSALGNGIAKAMTFFGGNARVDLRLNQMILRQIMELIKAGVLTEANAPFNRMKTMKPLKSDQ